MSDAIWWLGLFHLPVYAIAGSLFAFGLLLDWIIRRQKLTGDVVRAYVAVLKARKDSPNDR